MRRGEVVTPLDVEALRKTLQELKNKDEIEALTICFINAYVNGEHEVEARDVAREVFGDAADFHLLRGGAGDAGVRAHRDHRGQLLRGAGSGQLHE